MISSPSESQNIPVSGNIWFITKFERRRLARAICETGVGIRTGNFGVFSTYKPPYLRNGARQDQGCCWSLIGNHIRAFDFYQNQRPWMTPNWPWTAIMRSAALHTCLSEPTTKIWMKIDPYYQRQKCGPGGQDHSCYKDKDIRRGSLEWWLQMRVGSSKMAIFAYFTRYIFRTFISKATSIILCYVVP